MSQPQPNSKPLPKRWAGWVLAALISLSLTLGFGVVYFDDHAWGTWGDDSAGYIFLAGRMLADQPLVYFDDLAAAGQQFFGDERLARWLTPTHHQFINTHGVIASKYPVGASMLMVWAAQLSGSAEGFYLMTPVLATLNLVLVYLLALVLFPSHRFRHLIGLLAAVVLGVSGLYYDYAIAQPMREIPSMTMLLLTACLLLLGVRWLKGVSAGSRVESVAKMQRWQTPAAWLSLALSGLAFGMAFNIRETSLLVLPGFLLYGLMELWQAKARLATNLRRVVPGMAIFAFALVIAVIPTIQNSVAISKEKEVFKQRDTSEVVLLSNIGHVQTIGLENAFNNEGKFRPGKGALPHYWQIMQNSSPVPYFLAFAAIGLVMVWRRSRATASLLTLWILGVLVIFSLWINPYSRYILPLFPPLALLGSYGLAEFFGLLPTWVKQGWLRAVIAIAVSGTFIFAYQPVFADLAQNLKTDIYRFKAISRADLQTLVTLGEELKGSPKPVLMFSGDWQYGTSETLEAHTGLKTIRFPLEQRFIFDETQVNLFFDQILADGYHLFVWADSTSSPEFYAWLEARPATVVQELNFSFQPAVRIYQIAPSSQ